jgi:hypothetical protein
MTTRANATCVYCGTTRPTTTETCTKCGRGWIDERIAGGAGAPATGAGTPATGAGATEPAGIADVKPYPSIDHNVPALTPLPEPQSRRRLWVGLLSVAAIVIVVVVVGIVMNGGTPDTEDTVPLGSGEPGTTTATVSPTLAPTDTAPSSTVPSTTLASSTQAPPAASTTTTTVTAAPLPTFEVIGDPVPINELPLGAFAIGPFDFDTDAANPIGRLVATFGQPDRLVDADESWGLCPGEAGRAITWGPLTIVTNGTDGADETLTAYRLGPFIGTDAEHPAAQLTTLSGLAVDDTAQQIETIYANSTVDYRDVDGVPSFRLLRSNDDRLLLWGPIVDGAVAGIYSPRPCDQGP